MYCKCGIEIPDKRVELGYKTCVECSTEQKWSAVPIIYHKTGNTLQVVKDPEVAKEMIAMSRRAGFGIMRGMKPSQKSATYAPKTIVNAQSLLSRAAKPDPAVFERIGAEAMDIYEYEGKDRAANWLKKKVEDLTITSTEMVKIQNLLTAAFEVKKEEKSPKRKRWNGNKHRPEEKSEISKDIDFVFKNWKAF